MADNIQTPAGSGSDPAVATDEIASVHYQKVKIALGAESVLDTLLQAGQQSMANSLPVAIAANQTPVPVDATPSAPMASEYLPVRLTDGASFLTQAGGAAQADKSTFAEGSGSFTPIGGTFNDSLGSDPAEDQAAAARITAKRALHVNLRNAIGTEIGVAAAPVRTDPTGTTAQPVSGTVAVSSISASIVPGTGATHLGKAEDAAHASGDTGIFILGVRNDTNAVLTSADGDYGAFAIDGSGRQRVLTQGPEDHGVAIGPRPVVVGAEARTAEQTAVGSGAVTRLQADLLGKLVVRPHCIPEQQVGGVASTTGTSDATVIAAQGAGVRLHVTAISVANSSSTDAIVEIKDGTTVIWRTAAPQKGGSNMRFDPPLRLSANTALNMASLTAASTIYFSANGYRSAN
jgi:hypothetical protein